MTRTIEVTGLPEPVVEDIRKLVETLRGNFAPSRIGPPPDESAEEWIKRFHAWAESHPKGSVVIDDSRESIYAGRGE